MRMTVKIAGSFLISAALIGGAVFISTSALNATTSSLFSLSTVDQPRLLAFEGMYAEGLQTGQALRNIVINPGDTKAVSNLDSANKSFNAKWQEAMNLTTDATTIQALTDLKSNWAADTDAKTHVLSLLDLNKRDDAVEYIKTAETEKWRKVRSSLLNEIEQQKKIKAAKVAEVLANSSVALKEAVAISLVGLVSGIFLMIITLIQMTRRMRQAEEVVREIGEKGNLSVKIPVGGSDEVSGILSRLNVTRDLFVKVIKQANETSDNLVNASDIDKDKAKAIGIRLRSVIGMFTH